MVIMILIGIALVMPPSLWNEAFDMEFHYEVQVTEEEV